MTGHGTAHWDVAAYALGVLDPQDVVHCEAHLAECESCAAELEALLPTTKVLADVDLETLRSAEESQLLDRLVETVRSERSSRRARRRVLVGVGAAAAALAAGFSLFAGASWLAPPADLTGAPVTTLSPSPAGPPGIGGPDLGEGEQVAHTDPDTGVAAEVVLAATEWGTRVTLSLSGVNGPLECQLVLVRADGTTEVVGSWQVPVEGYGTTANPDPLLLPPASTAAERDALSRLEVHTTGTDGAPTMLVSVPL